MLDDKEENTNNKVTNNEYKEETWGKNVDGEAVIDGYKFRGRQPFRKAKESFAKLMVKGKQFEVGNVKCTVLDSRDKGIEREADIQMIENEKESRGTAVVKMYGPNKRKENVVLVTKYKQSDIKFVTSVAEKVVKPLIKKFLGVDKEEETGNVDSTNKCNYCEKTFKTESGLKCHVTKKHKEESDSLNTTNLKTDSSIMIIEDTDEENIDETNLEEFLDIKEEKKYTSKCKGCGHSFETSRKYELLQQIKKHNELCTMSSKSKQKKKQKSCETCKFVANDEQNLKRHKRDKHDVNTASTSPPPKRTKVDNKHEQEDMDIDEESQEDMDVDNIVNDAAIRSKLMDQKIEAKARKVEEEERMYREKKRKEEERNKVIEALEKEKRKRSINQNKRKIKDVKKKNRKKN